MPQPPTRKPAIDQLDDFLYGVAPFPVRCGRGVEIGAGMVVPEINFTLDTVEIDFCSWESIRKVYRETIESICQRAVELEVPSLLVEFETLPPMTVRPDWGIDILKVLNEVLEDFHSRKGLKSALRFTPNDTREHVRPPKMRSGEHWEKMSEIFERGVEAGADLLSIESTGGKEVSDDALLEGDLRGVVFALGVLAPRDMRFLWGEMVGACARGTTIPAGDTACGFANTAMALADRSLISSSFAALVRVLSAPRDLVAFDMGARGPSKDCAYEGPYLKAIAGIPISMEGRTAACAHLSHLGNISQAVCDAWSNESVQTTRLLSGPAPTVSMEQLAYDCRLMNTVSGRSLSEARSLRDWLTDSDSASNPQAYVLRPDVALRIAASICTESDPYRQARVAARQALDEMKKGIQEERLRIPEREKKWLLRMEREIDTLPDREEDFIEEMLPTMNRGKVLIEEYGL